MMKQVSPGVRVVLHCSLSLVLISVLLVLISQGKYVWVPDPDEVVVAGKAKDSFHPGEPTQVEVGYSIKILDEKRTAEVYEMNQQVLDPNINDLMALSRQCVWRS